MPLPVGNWKANVNGTEGALEIRTPSEQGLFEGALLNKPIKGVWNEGGQTIAFYAVLPGGGEMARFQAFFSGCLFSTPPNPEPGRDRDFTLCGIASTLPQTDYEPMPAHARRTTFGWMAQIRQID